MKQKQLILAAVVMAGCLYGCGASEATSDEPSGDAFGGGGRLQEAQIKEESSGGRSHR